MNAGHVVALGECMLELRHDVDGAAQLTSGGDTYNTAVYLARSGQGAIHVQYATVFGTDPYSERLIVAMQGEGIDTALVDRVDGRLPGLYLVHLDPHGERQFFYYRDASAARLLLDTAGRDKVAQALQACQWIYLSGITVAIMGEAGRQRLLDALQQARTRGARVAFDANYRPALWSDRDTARRVLTPFLDQVDLAMPSIDDEQALWDVTSAEEVIARYTRCGVREVVVKRGAAGMVVKIDDTPPVAVPAEPADRVVDTTAAGDAFNGAYLAARIRGEDPTVAACQGARLAARVIGHPGALIPADTD